MSTAKSVVVGQVVVAGDARTFQEARAAYRGKATLVAPIWRNLTAEGIRTKEVIFWNVSLKSPRRWHIMENDLLNPEEVIQVDRWSPWYLEENDATHHGRHYGVRSDGSRGTLTTR